MTYTNPALQALQSPNLKHKPVCLTLILIQNLNPATLKPKLKPIETLIPQLGTAQVARGPLGREGFSETLPIDHPKRRKLESPPTLQYLQVDPRAATLCAYAAGRSKQSFVRRCPLLLSFKLGRKAATHHATVVLAGCAQICQRLPSHRGRRP